MDTTNQKSINTVTHLSVLAQYFFPFANFILPLVIWSTQKQESTTITHSKAVLNFQLSLLLYTIAALAIAVPVLLFTVLESVPLAEIIEGDVFPANFSIGKFGALAVTAIFILIMLAILKIAEFFLVIYGAVKAANDQEYVYPLSIKFIK